MSSNTLGKLGFHFTTQLLQTAQASLGLERNLVCSPWSAIYMIAMLHRGAEGSTKSQFEKLFGNNENDVKSLLDQTMSFVEKVVKSSDLDMKSVGALWVDRTFQLKPDFVEFLKRFTVQINNCNFQSEASRCVKEVNAFVKKNTKGCIPKIIETISPDSRVVLLNAVYFKALWESPFSNSSTEPKSFHLLNGSKIKVRMMFQTHHFPFYETQEFQILQLPYKNNEFVMNILLPRKNDVQGFKRFSSANFLMQFQNGVPEAKKVEVDVYLPKFTMTSDLDLKTIFSKLGVTDSFDPDKANFSSMFTKETIEKHTSFLSIIIQKAFIEVNEEGTKAAAATLAMMGSGGVIMRQRKVFCADHAFIYWIQHLPSKQVLFVGTVCNPSSTS